MTRRWLSRRDFLRGAAAGGAALALLPACNTDPPAMGMPDAGQPASDLASADLAPTPTCEESQDNIEGPFYRAGAPERSEIATAADGEVVIIEGIVRGTAASCAALPGAEVDIWQADAAAVYDASASFRFRGITRTDTNGRYECRTILPGRYLNGTMYRPRHVHYKVRAAGFRELTTQLYFEGDPFNAADPFIHPSLIMPITKDGNVWRVTFHIVLAPV